MKTSFFEWFLFQIRIYDRMKVMLIANCILYFETPGIQNISTYQRWNGSEPGIRSIAPPPDRLAPAPHGSVCTTPSLPFGFFHFKNWVNLLFMLYVYNVYTLWTTWQKMMIAKNTVVFLILNWIHIEKKYVKFDEKIKREEGSLSISNVGYRVHQPTVHLRS